MLKVIKNNFDIRIVTSLTEGDTFIHPVSQQACQIVNFPYNPLPMFVNLENPSLVGVITKRRTENFRQTLDLYYDVTVCTATVTTVESTDRLKIIEISQRNAVLNSKNIELNDLVHDSAIMIGRIGLEVEALQHKLNEVKNVKR